MSAKIDVSCIVKLCAAEESNSFILGAGNSRNFVPLEISVCASVCASVCVCVYTFFHLRKLSPYSVEGVLV